ncbi:WecB/TagA/CpsF family glycosyltransferase [Natronoglycomyces albus]|uniref:WecB/TagA/CpsF family glycosyltransferase n=1 Tax=Natronoglycomyces albus TaxID=2811108 RepID=A0A895XK97_9ACTN|nr:WecB/TagA/CpsF family glycosyltransferase [Natronoglycomyces albus]QSB06171.1 WecB/TagA/CpsF family glycosyltransferase [Natronoglycomyces albus]
MSHPYAPKRRPEPHLRRARLPIGSGLYLDIDNVTSDAVLAQVFASLEEGSGGHIVTPNVDILAQARRSDEARELIAQADLVVADGAPLVWASRLSRQPLPERVAGSDLIWALSAAASAEGRSVALLGGTPDPEATPTSQAVTVLQNAYPGLKTVGAWCPPIGFDLDRQQWRQLVDEMVVANPDIVMVGLGFPKQERVIRRLRADLPHTWFIGCGASIDFVAEYRKRAPKWMQRSGLEWVHRMASEPRRLVRRYAMVGIPQAAKLMWGAWKLRRRNRP